MKKTLDFAINLKVDTTTLVVVSS